MMTWKVLSKWLGSLMILLHLRGRCAPRWAAARPEFMLRDLLPRV